MVGAVAPTGATAPTNNDTATGFHLLTFQRLSKRRGSRASDFLIYLCFSLFIQILHLILPPKDKTFEIMTRIVLNIEDSSLVPSLKQILGAIKGVTIDPVKPNVDEEKAFVTETITRGFREAKEGRFAGKGLTSLDTLVEELRAEA